MEDFDRNYNENLVHCLEIIDALISKVNKYNSVALHASKNSRILNINILNSEDILDINLDAIQNVYSDFMRNDNISEDEFKTKKEELKTNSKVLEDIFDEEILKIENKQNEAIYKKAIEHLYVSKWQNKQKEIEYLNYKDNFISKITGEAKFRALSIEMKEIESLLIKKEYAKKVKSYNGENIREIIIF